MCILLKLFNRVVCLRKSCTHVYGHDRRYRLHNPAMTSIIETDYNKISSVGTNALWFGFAALALAGLRIFGKYDDAVTI